MAAPGSNANGVPNVREVRRTDGKIEHYQRMSARITDQLTLDGIKKLIERMKAKKAALHPEQAQ
jgi:hypothetical protein